jgi:LuxR family maltose regulon positive regulatory protein
MHAAVDTPVLSIVAPPGYGKTTVMGQFQVEQERPTAWLTIDVTDSDPVVLLGNLSGSLASAGMLDEAAATGPTVGTGDVLTLGVNTLARSLDPSKAGVLLLDQVDHLRSQNALDVVGAVMTRLAGPLQVVVASRSGEGLPLHLLRSQGTVVELSTADLAMSEDEASDVFTSVGVSVGDGLSAIVDRTEGWPAGIYLTAKAMRAGAPSPAEQDIHGDDFYLADYLKHELLSSISDSTMSFLTRSSILTRLSGPLCDYVLETRDSAKVLSDLEQANLLIVPMDRTHTWYRYHSLLQDYLRSELDRFEPDLEASLHSRAATWFEDHGHPDLAIEHVQAAGEHDRFAAMVIGSARRVHAEGRMETITAWLQSLEQSKTIVDHPELAALGAFARALDGDAGGCERLAVFAFTDDEGRLHEDVALGPFALMLRSYLSMRGPEQAQTDARAARLAFGANVEWLHPALGAEAFATIAVEGTQAAEVLWTDGLWRSVSLEAHPFTTEALAQRALAAIERDDWALAETWIEDALAKIAERRLDRYVTSALAFTLAARLAARNGDVSLARAHLASAVGVRPRLTVAMPLVAVQSLNEMAKAFIEQADMAGARRVMRDAADIIAVRPRLGRLVTEHEAIKARLSELPAGSVGASSLTTAELRVLPLLVTHLTYPEIGERLFVSRHTIKTQAMSIYRKLGVSSRTEAVEKAREAGLISV